MLEIRHGGKQAITFVLCVALSIATLISLNSFKRDVHRSILSDAQALHGGDIILHAHYPFSEPLQDAVNDLVARQQVEQAKTHEFYSVIRPDDVDLSLFANIKVVDSAYPFYGPIQLLSGRDFQQVLQPGKVIVAPEIFDRLGVKVGAKLHIGSGILEIADSITHEPSRPVSFFSLGPRVFVSAADLDELDLLGKGSRLEYETLLKVADSEAVAGIAADLNNRAIPGQERVETARTARSGVKRFFDNLLFFLSFISIFTLLLGGIGMQASLSAMLRQKEKTIAIIKAVGATHRFLLVHYLAVVLILGLVGCIVGIGTGYALKHLFPFLFQGMLPVGTTLSLSLVDVVEGFILGLLVVILFTFLPLYRLGDIKPAAIFRSDLSGKARSPILFVTYLFGFLFLSILVVRQLDDVRTGIYFMLGCLGLITLITMVTAGILRLLRFIPVPLLSLRQALRSLYRPGNATRSIVVTLTSALSVVLTIFLLESNLFSTYIESYPEDAPNLFCIDIQQDQQEQFQAVIGSEVVFFPVIRARLLAINNEPIDREKERKRKSDSLAREFNLTYRGNLLEDEVILRGDRLFNKNRTPPGVVEVSVLDTIADIGNIGLNDRLTFNIQGVPLEALVTSIRTRTKSKLHPFFYFVFSEDVLGTAPQTMFAALHLDKEAIPGVITRIVKVMPNISMINAAETVIQLGVLMKRLSRVVVFFASFSILAGCLIMISAVFATRLARMREAVYYKVLGSGTRFVLAVLIYENIILGVLSSLPAALFANGGAWLLCRYFFEITYQVHWLGTIIMLFTTVTLVAVIGLASSYKIIRQKPAGFLRQQNGA